MRLNIPQERQALPPEKLASYRGQNKERQPANPSDEQQATLQQFQRWPGQMSPLKQLIQWASEHQRKVRWFLQSLWGCHDFLLLSKKGTTFLGIRSTRTMVLLSSDRTSIQVHAVGNVLRFWFRRAPP
jgi:hypothetical protein